jgi:hypothetical protein
MVAYVGFYDGDPPWPVPTDSETLIGQIVLLLDRWLSGNDGSSECDKRED